jgi:HEAT repeat protein
MLPWALIIALLSSASGCGNQSQAGGQLKRGYDGRVPFSQFQTCIALLKDPNPTVRADAADAIREMRIHGDAAVPAIAPLIANFGDTDKKAREWAAEAFGGIYTDAIFEPLVTAAKTKDNVVRAMSYYAIGNMPGDVKLAKATELLKVLLAGLHDEDAEVRYQVAWGFETSAEAITTDAVPHIIEALKIEQPRFQFMLIRSLGHIGDRGVSALPVLEKMRQHPNADVRSVSNITIHRIHDYIAANSAAKGSSPEPPKSPTNQPATEDGKPVPSKER